MLYDYSKGGRLLSSKLQPDDRKTESAFGKIILDWKAFFKSKDKKEKIEELLKELSKQRILQIMVLCGIVWMIIFNFIPMYGITIAFKDYKITSTILSAKWVGFKHFIDFFSDENFWNVMKNTLGISFLKLLIGFPLPIVFALLMNEIKNARLKKSVQTISYLPHFLSWVVLGGIMITWCSETGIINELLIKLNFITEPISFLAEPKYFWGIAVGSDIWKELGWNSIIYLAAMAGIDPALYEAATIDGASRLQKMWNITLPCIKGTIAILFILAVSGLLNSNFDQTLVLQNPLNLSSSEVIDTYAYKVGIRSARFSYATAVGLFKSLIALLLLITANKTAKRINGSSIF